MELRQLRYFIGVSEAGSLLQAAGRLHIAQPALGQQIQALEQELGARLFDRSNRGMTLTDEGRVFLEHARIVLADTERARQAIRNTASVPGGDVTIGLPMTVALAATLPILAACRQRFPQIRLKIIEAYSGFLREWLQLGRLDLALLFGDAPETGLAKQALLDEQLVFVTGRQAEPLPDAVSLQALSTWPMVLPSRDHGLRRIIDDACLPLGLRLEVVAEIDSLGSVKRAVEAGIGSTILSTGSVAQEVAAGTLHTARLDSPHMTRRVICATNMTRPASLAVSALAELVQDVLRDMVDSGAWPAVWIGSPAHPR